MLQDSAKCPEKPPIQPNIRNIIGRWEVVPFCGLYDAFPGLDRLRLASWSYLQAIAAESVVAAVADQTGDSRRDYSGSLAILGR